MTPGAGVAAIAPSTDTAAGKRQLVDHLQLELDRAKSVLKVSEQRNVMLAQLRCVVIGGLERRSGQPGSDDCPVQG
jgi:peptidoglycan DL-endopeptidase CwlO